MGNIALCPWLCLIVGSKSEAKAVQYNRSFSSDVTAAILVYQNNEMAAILVYGTGISSFLFKYFVLFHHPTGATDHVSENDLYNTIRYTLINSGTLKCDILQ